MKEKFIGIDLGGTHLRAALIDPTTGEVNHLIRIKTLAHLGHSDVIMRIENLVGELITQSGVDKQDIPAIGIGVPGSVDIKSGIILFLPNLPGQWRNVPISAILKKACGLPVFILNDVRSITLGEWKFGAGVGAANMACFAIGTGIGGGLILNHCLHLNFGGAAGELGHMVVEPDGLPCGCGGRGCLEMYASGPAIASMGKKFVMHGHTTRIAELAQHKVDNITTELVIRSAQEGDPRASYILEQAGFYLGVATNNILVSLGPEKVVFGGGVSQAGDLLLDHIRNYIQNQTHMIPVDQVDILTAKLGTNAGLVGAAIWAHQNL